LTKYEQEHILSLISDYLDALTHSAVIGSDERVIAYYRNRIMKEVSRAMGATRQ